MPPNAKALADQLLEAWNARDIPQFVDLLAEDVEWYDPAMPQPPARGRSEVQAFAKALLRAFPDFRYEILEPVCEAPDGSRCAVPGEEGRGSGLDFVNWNLRRSGVPF